MSAPVSVTAIISTYNEADIIGQVVEDLIRQEVSVYLLDDGSSDDTIREVEPFVGRGVIGIERFSMPNGNGAPHQFVWEPILRRKSQLAQQLAADWFIHHDADEFRESPWMGVSLRTGIQWVHDAGYNAIDFTCLEFDGDVETPSTVCDVKAAFPRYRRAADYNRVQIRCWRRGDHPVDLSSSGGHDAMFPARRVFPIRFILRHYPIRGRAHLLRKVLTERNYAPQERARGWHIHYEQRALDGRAATPSEDTFIYDAERVRLEQMMHPRSLEDAERRLEKLQAQVVELQREGRQLQAIVQERDRLIDDLYQSRSWRWSAPARWIGEWLGSRR